MKREIPNNWREQDAFTGWRKYLYWKPGELKDIKKGFNRRSRRAARNKIRKARNDD